MNDYWQSRARLKAKYKSKLQYVLSSIVPYTEANLKLAFKPNQFFNDLDKLDAVSKEVAKTTYYRAIRQGYVKTDNNGTPQLTERGRRKLKVYNPVKLGREAKIIVIFDIPETERTKRDHLRILLRELKFSQVQRSVWKSSYDSREILKQEIEHMGLKPHVKIYEALDLT